MRGHGFIWFFLLLLAGIIAFFGYRVIHEGAFTNSSDASPNAPAVLQTDPIRGNPNARLTVIEYGDYFCPLCRLEQSALKLFLVQYAANVRLVWKDFPLSDLHPDARTAAEAARCAQQQGRFWEMHDALFAHQNELTDAMYATLAAELQLDVPTFSTCMTNHETLSLIDESVTHANQQGIDGTPYYFFGDQGTQTLPNADTLRRFVNTP